MKTLQTWAGTSKFRYTSSIKEGTIVYFGKKSSTTINPAQYIKLLRHFQGRGKNIGTSQTDSLLNSVGDWLISNITKNYCFIHSPDIIYWNTKNKGNKN